MGPWGASHDSPLASSGNAVADNPSNAPAIQNFALLKNITNEGISKELNNGVDWNIGELIVVAALKLCKFDEMQNEIKRGCVLVLILKDRAAMRLLNSKYLSPRIYWTTRLTYVLHCLYLI